MTDYKAALEYLKKQTTWLAASDMMNMEHFHTALKALQIADKQQHYCPEWDYMKIDNTTPEFEACLCFDTQEAVE